MPEYTIICADRAGRTTDYTLEASDALAARRLAAGATPAGATIVGITEVEPRDSAGPAPLTPRSSEQTPTPPPAPRKSTSARLTGFACFFTAIIGAGAISVGLLSLGSGDPAIAAVGLTVAGIATAAVFPIVAALAALGELVKIALRIEARIEAAVSVR
ncbi:MAG: hypothetical protein AAFP26_11110 [Planctomycetota bacterium]